MAQINELETNHASSKIWIPGTRSSTRCMYRKVLLKAVAERAQAGGGPVFTDLDDVIVCEEDYGECHFLVVDESTIVVAEKKWDEVRYTAFWAGCLREKMSRWMPEPGYFGGDSPKKRTYEPLDFYHSGESRWYHG